MLNPAKYFLSIVFIFLLLTFNMLSAQVAINNDGSNPDSSAILDMKSTTLGMLIPRMSSAQRNSIINPSKGLLIFNNDTNGFWFYNGSSWVSLLDSTVVGTLPNGTAGQTLRNNGTNWLANSNFYNDGINIGIGTISPTQKLDVNGKIQMRTGAAAGYVPVSDSNGTMTWTNPTSLTTANDGDWTISGNDQYSAVSGNVGIGTSTPAEALHVSRQGADAIIKVESPSSGNEARIEFKKFGGYSAGVGYYSGNANLRLRTNTNDGILFEPNGVQKASLDVNGNFGAAGSVTAAGDLNVQNTNGTGSNNPYFRIDGNADKLYVIAESSFNGPATGTEIRFRTASGNLPALNRMTIDNIGNVGIGTTSPTQQLDVAGKIQMQTGAAAGYVPASDANGTMTWTNPNTLVTGLLPTGTTGQTLRHNGTNWVANSNLYHDGTNIGIGTTTPGAFLDINGTNAGTTSLQLRSGNTGVGTTSNQVTFGYSGTSDYRQAIKTRHNSGGDGNNAFDFYTWDFGTDAQTDVGTKRVMTIDGTGLGQIGIGTAAPAQALDVNGKIQMRTGATAGYVPVSDANGTMTWTNPTSLTTANNGGWTTSGNDIYNANTGNVGIGTTTPNFKLHIRNDLNTNAENWLLRLQNNNGEANTPTSGILFNVGDDGSAKAGIIFKRTANYGRGDLYFLNSNMGNAPLPTIAANTVMMIQADGNVGIGTTSPAQKLDVNGKIQMRSGATVGYIPVSDANGTMTWTNLATSTTTYVDEIRDADNNTKIQVEESANEDIIRFDAAGTQLYSMRKLAGGSPLLEVSSSNTLIGSGVGSTINGAGTFNTAVGAQAALSLTVGQKNVYIGDNAGGLNTIGSSNTLVGTTAGQFNDGGSRNTMIGGSAGRNNEFGSGNVFLGYSSGLSETGSNKLYIDNSNTATPLIYGDFSSNIININGNLGIGSSIPQSKFHVVDNFASLSQFVATVENTNGGAYANGLLIRAGQNTKTVNNRMISFTRPDSTVIGAVRQLTSTSVDYNTTSDERLKTNIHPTAKSLNDLMQIQVKDYVYKDDLGNPQTGFIAQQVFKIYPNVVSVGGDDAKTDPWMMDYGKMTPLLVKAVQDQQEQIEALKAASEVQQQQIEILKSENEQLKAQTAKVNDLEAMLLKMLAQINEKNRVVSKVIISEKK